MIPYPCTPVGPGPKPTGTHLVIEWEPGHVDGAGYMYDGVGVPWSYASVLHQQQGRAIGEVHPRTATGKALQWRRNEADGVSNHQPHDCLLKCLFKRRSKKTPKFRVTGLCGWNSPVTGKFPEQRASNTENVLIWWRHDESMSERMSTLHFAVLL